jgi:hypothetical protein
MNRLLPFACVALLGTSLALPAQTPQPAKGSEAAPRSHQAVDERAPDPAVLKAMKSQVFILHHASAVRVASILGPLRSGVNGCSLGETSGHTVNAITVRDFPDNLAAIAAAIQRLDVPTAAQPAQDVDLQIQVLIASPQASPGAALPKDLEPVVKSLQSTLSYRSYTLAASLSQRVRLNDSRVFLGRGQIEGSALGFGTPTNPRPLVFEWVISGPVPEKPSEGPADLYIRTFRFTLKDENLHQELAALDTGLTLKQGEHVVVGTSTVKGHGLIVVVSARRLP